MYITAQLIREDIILIISYWKTALNMKDTRVNVSVSDIFSTCVNFIGFFIPIPGEWTINHRPGIVFDLCIKFFSIHLASP